MTESFFIVHLIDKDNYNGINTLHNFPHDLFTTGRSTIRGDKVYIEGIEPKPQLPTDLLIRRFGMDIDSIWLGVNITPKESFLENVGLYNNLCSWIMDFLYLLRFLINLNLKVRVYFHVENYKEGRSNSKLSFQKLIDIKCDESSNFQVEYNQYQLVFPLLTKLLQYKPTDKLRAIMYNYASSKKSNSVLIDYFFSFATFEGIIHNWADANGYSQLWGTAIADPNEQERIHEDLRSHFKQFVDEQDLEDDKLKQLNSFKDSTFPTNRKIIRSLYQRFKSYYRKRLTEELQENEYIQKILKNFHRIYSRRNEIGHSLEKYTHSPGFVKDISTLMSTIKTIMDFELSLFLNDEIDWKFENRVNNLRDNMRPITQGKVLDKFNFKILPQNQCNIQLKDRIGIRLIEHVEFHTGMIPQDDIDNDSTNRFFSQNLRLTLPQSIFPIRYPAELKLFNIYENPYWWISTTQGNSNYIFKIFPPKIITTISNGGVQKTYCDIPSERILLVIKLDFIDIPDNLDIFS
jgi:hypothetical protein